MGSVEVGALDHPHPPRPRPLQAVAGDVVLAVKKRKKGRNGGAVQGTYFTTTNTNLIALKKLFVR